MAKWFSRRGLIFKAVQKHANLSHLGLVKLYIQIQLLFPRGSIYSTCTSRAEQTTETIKKFKLNLKFFLRRRYTNVFGHFRVSYLWSAEHAPLMIQPRGIPRTRAIHYSMQYRTRDLLMIILSANYLARKHFNCAYFQ